MHEIGIETSLVEAIRRGLKTVEGRLGKPRFLQIKEGDVLIVREDIWKDGVVIGSHDDALQLKVTQVLYFESFEEMLKAIDYEAVVPNAKNLQDAISKYDEFYSHKEEKEYGVVALFFEVVG